MNKFYEFYDSNNERAWSLSMIGAWDNLAWLALFGPFMIPLSFLFSWTVLLGGLPSEENSPWLVPKNEDDFFTYAYWELLWWISYQSVPGLFFF